MKQLFIPVQEAASTLGYRTVSAFNAARASGRIKLQPAEHARGVYDREAVMEEYRRITGKALKNDWAQTFSKRLEALDG